MDSLISIIVPIYNVEKYLCECIESLINQTYTNLEIILVDDGSTDSSSAICDEYALKDERIVVIHNQNGGVSRARNAGLDIMTGEYVLLADSDDLYEVDAVECLYNNIRQFDADMSAGSLIQITETGEKINDVVFNIPEDVVCIDNRAYWCHTVRSILGVIPAAKLCKRDVWDNLRYAEGIINEDEEILTRLVERYDKIVCTRKCCYRYRKRENSIVNTKFSIRNLDVAEFYRRRIEYFLDKGYYEYCYGTFSLGKEVLVKGYSLKGKYDVDYRTKLKSIYKNYRKTIVKLLPKVSNKKEKLYLRLFYANINLYILLRYRIMGKDIRR